VAASVQLDAAPAGLSRAVAWTDLGEKDFRLCRGQVLLRPAGDELQQEVVQLGHHPRVVLTQSPAPIDQDPQHGELLVVHDRTQPAHPGRTNPARVVSRNARKGRGSLSAPAP